MKSLLVLSLSLMVALGKPLSPHSQKSPALTEGNRSPLLGDFVPPQGHVEVEIPAPKPDLTPKEGLKPPQLTQNVLELEVKVKPEVQKEKLEAAEEEDEKLAGGGMVELKLEVKPAAKEAEKEAELNVMKEEEDKTESEKLESEVKADESSLKEAGDVEIEEKFDTTQEDQHEAEDDTDFKVESETKVDLQTQEKEEENVHMNPEEGSQIETAEWHIDMERPPEEPAHPVMESQEDDDRLEDEDDDSVLLEDQGQEEELVMEGVHRMLQQNSENLLDKEGQVGQDPGRADVEENEEVKESAQKKPLIEGRHCAGVVLDSKCYQFFRGPEIYKDAEYFCQGNFPGGHLASVTSPSIHREVLKLILEQGGSRVWIGGYRLDWNHFIWMDESIWSFTDWLSGEPNNTSGVEDCLEMLGNFGSEPGKFNDFTCWTPQAFVCSYPSH